MSFVYPILICEQRRQMFYQRINYLHFGNALESLSALSPTVYPRRQLKQDLIKEITSEGNFHFISELIMSYGGSCSKYINTNKFLSDISNTVKVKDFFSFLGCRGFSYRLNQSMELWKGVREQTNLRIALVPEKELFYPAKIRRFLSKVKNSNHYLFNDLPSIAFALGNKSVYAWFVLVLQSDLIFGRPSYVREHFRGWRKVLFANILRLALNKTKIVYLCQAKDIIKCCNPSLMPERIPRSWKNIYDNTAKDFGMKLVKINRQINIQTNRSLSPVYTDIFYKYEITSNTKFQLEKLFNNMM